MSTWKINFNEQTAISINGIPFKLTGKNGEYEGFYLNPKDIPLATSHWLVSRGR